MEYWANSVNPATARARFREAIDVILKAWTQPGPMGYAGEFYNYRYLNPWPTPYQKPHPPAYIVGSGSEETVELAAELGLGYSVVFIPTSAQLKVFDRYRERLAHHGHEVNSKKVTFGVMAYVAENDKQAEEEFMPHCMYFFETGLKTTPRYLMITLKESQVLQSLGVTVISLHPGWIRSEMGGPSATLDPDVAATSIVDLVDGLTLDNTGSFYQWDGTIHPW